jgi:hypothetical protein
MRQQNYLAVLLIVVGTAPWISSCEPTLYGVDVVTDQLWQISTNSGAGVAVGPTGFDSVKGLTCDEETGVLYGVNSPFGAGSTLITINRQTGQATAIGDIGFANVTGLLISGTTPGLGFLAVTSQNQLLTIDGSTGEGEVWCTTDTSLLDSLALSFTGIVSAKNSLYDVTPRCVPFLGECCDFPIGPTGFSNVSGLAFFTGSLFNPTPVLYGASRAGGELITIDQYTGQGTKVGNLPNTGFNGLALCPPG